MVLRGAFAEISAVGVEGGAYIKLGGKNGGKIVPPSPEEMNIAELAETHFMELNKLLSSFREPEQGYPSRALAQFIKRAGDFDHLARVKEWSASGGVGVDEG